MDTPRLLDGRLKLRHLVLVDALSEQHSLVGAAAALYITQPVVTRSLQELESILGVSLYDRGPRGITPTEFGIAFTGHARAVLAQIGQAESHIAELADASRGQVVVGTHLAGSNLLLPRAIVRLKADRPSLNVIVREAAPEALLIELSAGRIDLIVGRLTGPRPEGTRRHMLHQEPVQLVVGSQHELAHRDQVTVEDLRDLPWVLPGVATALRRELENFFLLNDLDFPANRVEATSFLTVRQLLIETDMVAALPGLIGGDDPRLTTLPLSLEPIGHRVGMTLAADRRLSPAAQALIASLRFIAGKLEGQSAGQGVAG